MTVDTVDGIRFCNCGLEFQNGTYANTVKLYEV